MTFHFLFPRLKCDWSLLLVKSSLRRNFNSYSTSNYKAVQFGPRGRVTVLKPSSNSSRFLSTDSGSVLTCPKCRLSRPFRVPFRRMSTSGSPQGSPSLGANFAKLGPNLPCPKPSTSSLEDQDQERVPLREPARTNSNEAEESSRIGRVDVPEFMSSWQWLQDFGPGFPVKGEQVKVIQSPAEFYSELVVRAKRARKRVVLASLYLGSGSLEKDLVRALEENAKENEGLKIRVLLDFTRGSRGLDVSSRTMLLPLIAACDNCEVFLYHTPELRGLKKRWLPQRWNEIIGLQHMKIYIFDDSVIISGANLSADYFTNRQDRYVVIEGSKELTDFYEGLVERVGSFSFRLDSKNEAELDSAWKLHPSEADLEEFVKTARSHVQTYYEDCIKENQDRLVQFRSEAETERVANTNDDTWIFPLIQMGVFGLSFDQDATRRVFERSPTGSHIKLATGYFNLTAEYIESIIQKSSSSYDILMAHPTANGFLNARGVAGGIPHAYSLIAKQFLDKATENKQMYRLSMSEYMRNGWTFHSKGLWYYPTNSSLPWATLIGSPNFGHRSVYKDLETQLYIVTLNRGLMKQLEDEQNYLFSFSKPFVTTELSQPDRVVPLWVRMVVLVFRNFF